MNWALLYSHIDINDEVKMTLISIYGCANDISVTYLSRIWRPIVFPGLCFYKERGRTASPPPPPRPS